MFGLKNELILVLICRFDLCFGFDSVLILRFDFWFEGGFYFTVLEMVIICLCGIGDSGTDVGSLLAWHSSKKGKKETWVKK